MKQVRGDSLTSPFGRLNVPLTNHFVARVAKDAIMSGVRYRWYDKRCFGR